MLAIANAECDWSSCVGRGGAESEVVKLDKEETLLERAEECEESGCGLGLKLGKNPMTSSLKEVACLIWMDGPLG